MIVFVAEGGWYENRAIRGIYASAAAAMRAHPGQWVRDDFTWRGRTYESWSRDVADESDDDADDIVEHDVIE